MLETEVRVQRDDAEVRLARLCTMRAEHRLDTVLIRPCGEFDMSCERPFREQLSRLLDADTSAVILDLQELSFIDSTGL